MSLPPVDRKSEDAFIADFMATEDVDGLVQAISAALEAKRPQLAARLVGLLDDDVDHEPDSPLLRAQRAANLLLIQPTEQQYASDFEEAWAETKRKRIRKIKKRMRSRTLGRTRRKR